MEYTPLESLAAAHLRALIGVAPERKRREYKEMLPPSRGDDHREFINDVSSFANSEGGDLLFGVREDRETHMAGEIVGISTPEIESNIARLENLIRDGIRPRLPRIAMHTVEVGERQSVLVTRIGESHLAPHQNILNHRFYARNTNGKYILEVGELRDMILRRESLPDRIRAFRRTRIDLICNHAEDMPLRVDVPRKFILHFIPIQTFGRFNVVDPARFASEAPLRNQVTQRLPIRSTGLGLSFRANIDGYMFMSGRGNVAFPFYVQVFGDGAVEFVDSTAFINLDNEPTFGAGPFEDNLFLAYEFVRGIYDALAITGPVYVLMSAVGIRECSMVLPNQYIPRTLALVEHNASIGRDPALFHEIIVEDMNEDASAALYDVVAQMWHAAAYDRPLSYAEDGRYTGMRGY